MTERRKKKTAVNNTPKRSPNTNFGPDDQLMKPTPTEDLAVSSSLNSIHISPRTPRSTSRVAFDEAGEDDVELSLLGDDERRQAAYGVDREYGSGVGDSKHPISAEDKRAMVLLCVLCELCFL